jgi:hypothetical protein
MVQTVGETQMGFQCRACGLFWVRSGSAKPGFAWESVSERAACHPALGLPVPPRSGSDQKRPLPFRAWTEQAVRIQQETRFTALTRGRTDAS